MKTSEDIKEICKALLAFHSEVGRITKDGENPHLRNRYATIDQIIEEIRPILASHGLFVMQLPTNTEAGEIQMVTRLYHVSGQWMESPSLKIKVDRNNAQGIGSAITYARRYSLTSFLGLNTGEDDDGHQASGGDNGQAPKREHQAKQQMKKPAQPQQPRMEAEAQQEQKQQPNDLVVKKQKEIIEKARDKGMDNDQIRKLFRVALKRNTYNDMTAEEANNLLEFVSTAEFIDLIEMIDEKATQKQISAIHAAASESGVDEKERRSIIKLVTNNRTDSSKGLTKQEASKVIERIKAKKALKNALNEFKQNQELKQAQ